MPSVFRYRRSTKKNSKQVSETLAMGLISEIVFYKICQKVYKKDCCTKIIFLKSL